jgi:hypothetical protein
MEMPLELWQAESMGNKGTGKREAKKPKQKKPARGNFIQPVPRLTKEPVK